MQDFDVVLHSKGPQSDKETRITYETSSEGPQSHLRTSVGDNPESSEVNQILYHDCDDYAKYIIWWLWKEKSFKQLASSKAQE